MGDIHRLVGDDSGEITLPQRLARAFVVLLIGLALFRLTTPRLFSRTMPLDIASRLSSAPT